MKLKVLLILLIIGSFFLIAGLPGEGRKLCIPSPIQGCHCWYEPINEDIGVCHCWCPIKGPIR